MSRKVFISQPMGTKSNAQIDSERAELVKRFESEGYKLGRTYKRGKNGFDYNKSQAEAGN